MGNTLGKASKVVFKPNPHHSGSMQEAEGPHPSPQIKLAESSLESPLVSLHRNGAGLCPTWAENKKASQQRKKTWWQDLILRAPAFPTDTRAAGAWHFLKCNRLIHPVLGESIFSALCLVWSLLGKTEWADNNNDVSTSPAHGSLPYLVIVFFKLWTLGLWESLAFS